MVTSLLRCEANLGNTMILGRDAKLAELNAFLDWLETGRTVVPSDPGHAGLLAILQSAIAKTRHSIQTLAGSKSN